jgi:S1-C subfamily serine protease
LKTGDVYEEAVLIGLDERRDIATINISARVFRPFQIGSSQNAQPGEKIYVVSNSAGLP